MNLVALLLELAAYASESPRALEDNSVRLIDIFQIVVINKVEITVLDIKPILWRLNVIIAIKLPGITFGLLLCLATIPIAVIIFRLLILKSLFIHYCN